MEKKILLHIGGMTCVNCQNKIEKELNHTNGVISASISYQTGKGDVTYDAAKISVQDIVAVIEKLDYEVPENPQKQTPDIMSIVCMLAIIIALYVILEAMGLLNLPVPSQLADTGMGYGMLFILV